MILTELLVFAVLALILSAIYLYLFSRHKERFLQYWGFSSIAYFCSLLCLILFITYEQQYFLEIRKVADMFNLLFLMFGTYSFTNTKTPDYWYRFSLYLLLLAVICIIYHVELLSFYLPISVYQFIITCTICVCVIRRWRVSGIERVMSSLIFFIWGTVKTSLSIFEVFTEMSYNYMVEISLFNLLNFCILVVYISYTRSRGSLVDSLYKIVMDNAVDVIFYYRLKPDNAFEYISPSVERVTGYAPSDFYGNPRFYMNLITKNEKTRPWSLIDVFTNIKNNKEPYAIQLCAKDGTVFWGEFTGSIIEDDSGNPVAIEGTMRDITNMKTTEKEQLDATYSRNRLLSYISHELRTPITSIAGYLTAINDGTMESEDEKQEAMNIIDNKIITLKKLIDDLDQLSKLETKQFTFEYETYTASEVTEYLIDDCIPDAVASDFDIRIEFDSTALDDIWIVIDLGRIKQVFSNLLNNAIKYSPDSKRLYFAFKIDDTAENYVVSIRDMGIGIKDGELDHVFDRFYRTNCANDGKFAVEGRGLGLTLCKEILAAHQGDIYVESVYGSGSTFTFIIPIYKEA